MDESATAELVDVTRSLMTAVRTADAPRDALDRASALVREATDLLAAHHVDGTPGTERAAGRRHQLGSSSPPAIPHASSRTAPWSDR